MARRLALTLALVVVAAACASEPRQAGPAADQDAPGPTGDEQDAGAADGADAPAPRVTAVATVAPLADLVAQVLGDRGRVTSLVPSGANSHTYEPRPGDVAELEDADVYFGNGLGLNDGALELAETSVGAGVPVVRLAEEALDPDELAEAPGHTHADGQGHEHDHEHGTEPGHEHDGDGANPHTWLSVPAASAKVEVIADVLAEVDPDGEDAYRSAAEDYHAELDALHAAITEAAATVPDEHRTIVTFHDAYGYFGDEYGFDVVGAVQPSDFSEPSTGDVAALIDQVEAEGVPAVFGSSVFPDRVAEQIAAETGARYHDGLADDVLPGDPGDPEHSYIALMAANARTIIEGLGGDAAALPDPGR